MTEQWDGEHDVTPHGMWYKPQLDPITRHFPRNPAVLQADLEVTFYHGAADGKPVIQIDGDADFRINVNDAPIWDQSPEAESVADVVHQYLNSGMDGDYAIGVIGRMVGVIPREEES